jgi:hypothetical protein
VTFLDMVSAWDKILFMENSTRTVNRQ